MRPSTQRPDLYEQHVLPGEPLDVDAWMGEREPEQEQVVEAGERATELDPYAAKAIEAELVRLDECDVLGLEG